jgi:hypothetical protein
VHGDPSVQSIERGPSASGIYARFGTNGQALTLLDGRGRPTSTLAAGAGLIAATKDVEGAIVWVVSGTDEAGTKSAAHAFDQSTLEDHFAVALSAAGTQVSVPQESG